MEYYESRCAKAKCNHRWQWVGYKTGLGKTPAQLAEMEVAGKTCPQCGSPATVGLDHTSPAGRDSDESLRSLAEILFGGKPKGD